MQQQAISIRPFIGAKDYEVSRQFYRALGFEEVVLSPSMSLFAAPPIHFYLQKAYVKDWIDNTMIFVEVPNATAYWQQLSELRLPDQFAGVKLSSVVEQDWGKECFLHDPSGVLWHWGEFKKMES